MFSEPVTVKYSGRPCAVKASARGGLSILADGGIVWLGDAHGTDDPISRRIDDDQLVAAETQD